MLLDLLNTDPFGILFTNQSLLDNDKDGIEDIVPSPDRIALPPYAPRPTSKGLKVIGQTERNVSRFG